MCKYECQDFLKLMPKLNELDINDPRNEVLLATLFAAGGLMAGRDADEDVFRLLHDETSLLLKENNVSYANYLKFQQGLRIKLLQLRTKKPYLFSGPIPLDENVLKHSEIYKNLIASAYPADTDRGKLIIHDATMGESTTASGGYAMSVAGESESSSQIGGDGTYSSKKKVSDFLIRVREAQQQNMKTSKKFYMTSHMVRKPTFNSNPNPEPKPKPNPNYPADQTNPTANLNLNSNPRLLN